MLVRPCSKRQYEKIITDPKAPERLRGRKITAEFEQAGMNIRIDLPDDYTRQEQAYLRYSVGELVDSLREKLPELVVGDPQMTCPPSTLAAVGLPKEGGR